MPALRTLIVEDEPPAAAFLETALRNEPGIEVCGVCTDGLLARDRLKEGGIDLVFLDVQLGGLDGFGVIDAVGVGRMPRIIFTTAYDRYALKAFEVHAVDYLLKPFDDERLRSALDRVRGETSKSQIDAMTVSLRALLGDPRYARGTVERLVVRSNGKAILVPVSEIEWIEAAGNYCEIHAGRETHLVRASISSLADDLDAHRFARVHRSTIVRIDRIRQIETTFQGDYVLTLKDGTRLNAGRSYRNVIQDLLGKEKD